MITDRVPLSLPTKYGDLIQPLENWARTIMRKIEGDTAVAQGDATTSLNGLSALAQQNERDIKRANFLRHWHGC